MHTVEPKVFLISEPRLNGPEIERFLSHVGAPDWLSDAPSDAEQLVEIMGRLCYKSWVPGLNPNVRKVRTSNAEYIDNILKSRHGAVVEHANFSFIFADVSRVFTHELVRHRAGTAISQESLRYVRLTNLGQWLPTVILEDKEAMTIFAETFEQLEATQVKLAEHFRLDDEATDFAKKKVITSAMRRIAPIGLATNIGWTANVRTIRWCIEQRTSPHAEEEIRLVFGKVAQIMQEKSPSLFADFESEVVDGLPCYTPKYSKV